MARVVVIGVGFAGHTAALYLSSELGRQADRHRAEAQLRGHPKATCQGAALEHISNIHKDLVKRGLRQCAELVYLRWPDTLLSWTPEPNTTTIHPK